MIKIDTKKYKGFETSFFVMPKTKGFLDKNKINLKEHLPDDFHWYEHELFSILDPDELSSNWNEEKETRRKFKVVFYGIIRTLAKEDKEGFKESFDDNKKEIIYDSSLSIHSDKNNPFAVRYKILLEN